MRFNLILTGFTFLLCGLLLSQSIALASPSGSSHTISDKNMKIAFEVHSPWNILDGVAEDASGKVSIGALGGPDRLRADLAVQNIQYKAGLSTAGRLVSLWLRANPPTPAKFVIDRSSLECNQPEGVQQTSCTGSVDGKLTIWGKLYTMDVPVQLKPAETGVLLTGLKEIKWGEYGFGDPESTIANLKPVIELTFSIELSPSALESLKTAS